MKINRNKLFDYPMLNHLRDDYKSTSDLNTIVKAKQFISFVEFEISFILMDKNIQECIDQEFFTFVLHIECSKTKFRHIYKLEKNNFKFSIKIDSKHLNGNVEILPMIICNISEYKYKNSSFSSDYGDLAFDLQYGSVVAYDDTSFTYIEKDKKDYVGVPSVIIVTKHSGEDTSMSIDVETGSKIVVDLHELDYESYHALVGSDINAQISHQLIIFPAVLKALEAMCDMEFRSEIEHKKWFLTFKKQLKAMKIDVDDSDFLTGRDKFKIAQKILDNPVNRAFDNLLILQEEI